MSTLNPKVRNLGRERLGSDRDVEVIMDAIPEGVHGSDQMEELPPWIWIMQLSESSSLTCKTDDQKMDLVPLVLAF